MRMHQKALKGKRARPTAVVGGSPGAGDGEVGSGRGGRPWTGDVRR
jgi:hypothetical protein